MARRRLCNLKIQSRRSYVTRIEIASRDCWKPAILLSDFIPYRPYSIIVERLDIGNRRFEVGPRNKSRRHNSIFGLFKMVLLEYVTSKIFHFERTTGSESP